MAAFVNTNDFIFSNKIKYKLARHFAFWLIFCLHFVIQNLMIGGPGEGKTSRTFPESFLHTLYFLPIYLISTYLFMEVLLAKFLYKERYGRFVMFFLLLYVFSFSAVYFSGQLYIHHTTGITFSKVTFNANKYHIIVDGIFVPFMLFAIAAGIKFSKKWYLQQRENEKLAEQKLATELQLLKTSIQPRFLFHSLQTVRRYINSSSSKAPGLILQLSDLLSYILYERNESWAPLKKELDVISSYISFEEKSFGDSIVFNTEFPENTADKFIVPFLLMSVVESSFEYLFETQQQLPSLTLNIWVTGNTLYFKLSFSKAAGASSNRILQDDKFISFQTQLQSHYHRLHHLQISDDAATISIELRLQIYSGDLTHLTKNASMNEVSEPV